MSGKTLRSYIYFKLSHMLDPARRPEPDITPYFNIIFIFIELPPVSDSVPSWKAMCRRREIHKGSSRSRSFSCRPSVSVSMSAGYSLFLKKNSISFL